MNASSPGYRVICIAATIHGYLRSALSCQSHASHRQVLATIPALLYILLQSRGFGKAEHST